MFSMKKQMYLVQLLRAVRSVDAVSRRENEMNARTLHSLFLSRLPIFPLSGYFNWILYLLTFLYSKRTLPAIITVYNFTHIHICSTVITFHSFTVFCVFSPAAFSLASKRLICLQKKKIVVFSFFACFLAADFAEL